MSCVKSNFRTFGKYSDKFGFRKNWKSVTSRHFTSLHDYHVVCSIHTSEHSVNSRANSAFGKIRLSDNCRFRTYVILHCLNQIRIFYNFPSSDTQKIFQNIFLSAQWIVIPAKMIVACSLERKWIAEGTRHRSKRQNNQHGITLIDIDPFRRLNRWRICQSAKFALVSNE